MHRLHACAITAIAKKRITKAAVVLKTDMVMKVHSIIQVPIPEVMKDKKKKDTVTEIMKNTIFNGVNIFSFIAIGHLTKFDSLSYLLNFCMIWFKRMIETIQCI